MGCVYIHVTVAHDFVLPGVYGFGVPKRYLCYFSMPYPYSTATPAENA